MALAEKQWLGSRYATQSSFHSFPPSDNIPDDKVCRNILVVERTSGTDGGLPGWICSVDCFRLSLSPENDKVIATKVSSFDTFGFDYVDFSHKTISDHSGKYYAVYSRAGASRNGGALQIWEIETGEMVRRIPDAEFPKIPNVTNVLVIAKQGPDGPQQVVVAGNDRAKNSRARWSQVPGEWGYMADFKVFPIEAGSSEWAGCIEKHKKQRGRSSSPPREAPLLASSFKVPRCPAGITTPDTPGAPGYLGEEIGLTLWNLDAGNVCSFYHRIIPDQPPASAPDVPLAVEREFRMAVKGKGNPCSPPATVGSRSGLSLTIDLIIRHEALRWEHRILSRLCVRSFYPSTTPGVMDLEWESYLRSSNDREKLRVFCTNTNMMNRFSTRPLLIDEDELGIALLEEVKEGVDLVLLLWDDRFHGELPRALGGKVLS